MVHFSAGEAEAVALLRRSVFDAHRVMPSGPADRVRVNEVLAALAAELAPGFPHLYAVADAWPCGPVAAVLAQLRIAFAHAAAGRPAPAVGSLAAASAYAFRLADGGVLDARDREVEDRAS